MKVVDLRNIFASCNDVLIEVTDHFIYYAEEKQEEGHNNLFLLEYNRDTRRERIISNYFLNNPAFVQHFFSFPDDIVIVLEAGGSEAWILRVDKHTGEEKNLVRLGLIGEICDCAALDESHLIIYTSENEEHKRMFGEYQKKSGCSKMAYLYDLNDETYFFVRDPRICSADSAGLIPYESEGDMQLLILQPSGTEAEKEKCYHDRRWVGDNICDRVWLCPLFDFIVSVKSGEECAPLGLILSADTSGLVRYAGMDEDNLYFRARYFPANDQRLCAFHKQSGKKYVVAELNLGEGERPAWFSIDMAAGHAYRIREQEDTWEVDGVLNSDVHAEYSKELGDFTACADDRFIIARYVLSDDRDSFEFNSILDVDTGEQKSFECRCMVKGGTVVLY
jgi:hypothetical protein